MEDEVNSIVERVCGRHTACMGTRVTGFVTYGTCEPDAVEWYRRIGIVLSRSGWSNVNVVAESIVVLVVVSMTPLLLLQRST